jgi:hypothetical protein
MDTYASGSMFNVGTDALRFATGRAYVRLVLVEEALVGQASRAAGIPRFECLVRQPRAK